MFFKEYERSYKNFDRCMQAFEEIILICQARKDFTIAEIVTRCINELDVKKN